MLAALFPVRLIAPVPPFTGLQRLPDPSSSPGLPSEIRERISHGRLTSPLPYALQNGYRRELRTQEIPAIQLTNSSLDALVLPTLGGRLWSLRDLRTGRDLVFRNPRLQFANFALTDAWFAGGIEWNLGSTGHATTTCRPVFTMSTSSDLILRRRIPRGVPHRNGASASMGGRSGESSSITVIPEERRL